MKLFTTITDLSNHTGPLTKIADALLNRVAPQQIGIAKTCGAWEYYGCCANNTTRYRRFCLVGSHTQYEYKCSSSRCYV